MKSFITSVAGLTFVVLASTVSFAAATIPPHATTAHSSLSEADALRLKLALIADQTKGN